MSEDKADTSPQQDPPKAVNLTEALFGPHLDQCWVTAGIAGNKATWTGHPYKRDRVEAFDPMHGHYFSIALIRKGSTTRSAFDGGIVIVADDVGYVTPDGVLPISPGAEVDINTFAMFAPETSYEVETSHGNFQMGWRISPVEKDYARWHHFIEQMKKHELFGKAFEKCTGVHYARMETGSNQPKPNRPRFKSKLAKAYTGLTYTLDELANQFGIDMARPQASVRTASGEQLPPVAVKKLLEMLPNDAKADYGYDVWVKIGHAIYGATNGSLEGLNLYEWWSAQSPRYGLTETPDQKWDSFYNAGASASTLRVLIEEKWGPDSKERKQASQIFASEAFPGELPDAVGIDAAAGAKEKEEAEKDFMALVHEARTLAKIPAKFRRESDDPNWLKDEQFENAFDLAAVTQPASPTVFAPYDRGVVSVRTGAPFSGKSLLMLDQSAAFTCERTDLLGVGFGPGSIQFAGDVLYFCNEDLRSVAVRRLQAWSTRHGNPVAKHQLILVRSNLMKRDGDYKPPIIECLRVLRIAVSHLRAGRSFPLIVFDTIRASMSGVNENSVEETAEVLALMKWIAWGFWSAVVFIHHGTKGSWNDGDPKLGTALSGSGNFGGTVRGADSVRVLAEKEKIEKGWGGRKIVGCATIKASDDDMAGERYYEIETVGVLAEHAEQDGVQVMKGMPVAVPILPVVAMAGFINEAERSELVDKLVAAMANGPVWRFRREPKKDVETGVAVHDLWEMEAKKASEIIDKIVSEGGFKIVSVRVGNNVYHDQIECVG